MQAQDGPTTIYCDSKSTIALPKNHVFHKRKKHIDTKDHFIRELVSSRKIVRNDKIEQGTKTIQVS